MAAHAHSGTLDALSQALSRQVRRRHSLRTRIALWSGLVAVAVVVLMTAAMAIYAHWQIDREARLDTVANARQAAEQLATTMNTVTVTTGALSDLAANSGLDPEALTATLRAMIRATPGCAGGLLILQPDAPGQAPFARYVSLNGADRDMIADGYDYGAKDWFRRTLAASAGWWSEPYFNETAGGVWMVTYNAPLRPQGTGGSARGMVSLDLPLSTLTDDLQTLARQPGWRVSLIAPEGTLAMNPEVDIARTVLSLDGFIARFGRSDLAPAAEAVRLHRALQMSHTDARNGERRFTVVEPVGGSGWSLLVAQSHALIAARTDQALLLLALGGLLVALVCTLVVNRLAGRIAKPVQRLSESAARLAEGDYDAPVPDTGGSDEVGLMARTLDQARNSIRRQLVEIEEMGAARQKLESELSIARDIQLAMLPPGRVIDHADHHLEAYAQLEPAKAVGGDFYSFIEPKDGELWFAIGDVSDKGVPAALFMARTSAVLEGAARAGGDPSQVLASASRRLVEGNDTCMFATVLCGRIDVRSGACLLASAGHDPPLLLHPDGRVDTVPLETGGPLGFEPSDAFPLWRGRLEPGMTLLAYTDGVTEAFDAHNVAFGMERLVATVHADRDARGQCERLIAEAHAFAHPTAQDDITVLAIRLRLDPAHDTTNETTRAC
jgi:sigma-B regulation protein RsbU (phosphoserine phosphatase)